MIRISPKFAQAIRKVIRLTAIVAFAFTAGLWVGYHKNPASVLGEQIRSSYVSETNRIWNSIQSDLRTASGAMGVSSRTGQGD